MAIFYFYAFTFLHISNSTTAVFPIISILLCIYINSFIPRETHGNVSIYGDEIVYKI